MITLAVCRDTESCWGIKRLNKQFLMLAGVGVVVMAALVFGLYSGNKASHLELKGKVIKARNGSLDEMGSVSVLDFRLENPSDVRFVVRQVKVTLEKADGSKVEGQLTSKTDLKQLFEYNKFLGKPYNDTLSIKDQIGAHQQVDRMVAARFELPLKDLESSKSIVLWIQDLDGAEFETTYKLG